MGRRIVALSCLLALLLALLPVVETRGAEGGGIPVEVVIPEGAGYAVMDVMDGVEARYRLTEHGDVYGEYSCAGYVKAYCQAVYGVTVQNLTDSGPLTPLDKLMLVDTPQRGDIIFYPSPPHANNHSAIVKDFDGERVTLIEQNYKWAQDGGTYTYLNRTIPFTLNENDYEIWRCQPEALPVIDPRTLLEPEPSETPLPFIDPQTLLEPTEEPVSPPTEEPVLTEEPQPQPTEEPQHPPLFVEPTPLYEAVVTVGALSINVNGWDMPIEAPALIENSRAVMPVRFVGYALGLAAGDILWDPSARSVHIRNGGDIITIPVDSDVLYVNGREVQMDCPAFIRGNYTYLPLKYLAEALNVQYQWDGEAQAVRFFRYA